MSCTHIQIDYVLDDEARTQIWATMFDKLQDYLEGSPDIRCEWNAKGYVRGFEEVRMLAWMGGNGRRPAELQINYILKPSF